MIGGKDFMEKNNSKQARFAHLGSVRMLKENAGIIIGFFALVLILGFATDKFLTFSNITNVVRQITMNILLCCGLGVVLIYGGIDLSVGAVLGLAACLSAGFVDRLGMPWPLAVLLAILIGSSVGAFNGLVLTRTNIPPFIVTLAMQNVIRGVCRVYTGEKTIVISNQNFIFIGTGSVAGIPIQIIWILFATILTAMILRRTTLGRHIYAAGGNQQAAVYSGINVRRVGMFVYIFSAFMASLAGVYTASRTYAAMYSTGVGAETNAISAIVLGGISMSGGVGGIFGVIFGVLLIGILSNGMNLLGINSSWQYIVQGAVILIAVCVDFFRKQRKKVKSEIK